MEEFNLQIMNKEGYFASERKYKTNKGKINLAEKKIEEEPYCPHKRVRIQKKVLLLNSRKPD